MLEAIYLVALVLPCSDAVEVLVLYTCGHGVFVIFAILRALVTILWKCNGYFNISGA